MTRLSALSVSQLGRKSLAALLARLVGAGAGFGFQVALARALGAEEAGIYALALTLSLVAAVVGRAGIDSAVLRYGALAYARHDAAGLAAVLNSVHGRVLPASIGLAAIGILAAPWVAATVFDSPGLGPPLQWMFASLPMLSLATLYAELLRASDRHVTAALLQSAAVPLTGLVLLSTFGSHVDSASALAVVYVGATTSMMLLARLAWASAARRTAGPGSDALVPAEPVSSRTVFNTGLRMFPAALAGILMAWADILLLGIWAPSEQVGVYNAAVRTALLSSFMLLAINSVVAPRFAATSLRDDIQATATLARRACSFSLLATAPILALFVFFSEQVLGLFGPQFVAGGTALIIVSMGQVVNAATGPVGHLLNMRGFHVDESRLSMSAAFLNIGLCFVLIPRFGATGAALANALAIASCNVGRVLMVRVRLRVWVYPRF